MNKKLILAFVSPLVLLASAHGKTIDVQAYGLAEGADATPAIIRALEACRKSKADRLVFPKGTYHLYPDRAEDRYLSASNNDAGMRRIVFDLTDFEGLTIDGQGSIFICHGKMIPFLVDRSKDIRLTGFSIDWNRPFFLQGQVTAVNPSEHAFDLKIHEECIYQVVGGQLYFMGKEIPQKSAFNANGLASEMGWVQNIDWNIWMDPVTKGGAYLHQDSVVRSVMNDRRYRVEDIGEGTVRIYDAVKTMPQVGWVLIVKGLNPDNRSSPAIHMRDSVNLELVDIDIHHAGAMGLIAQKCENIRMKNFNVVLPEGKNRYCTTTADATHFVSCRGAIKFEDCLFENMLDDAVNVHGIYVRVDPEPVDDYTIGIQRMHNQQLGFPFAGPGDEIRLADRETLAPYRTLVVAGVREYNREYMEIAFTEPVRELLEPNSVADNLSWQADLEFKNCVVRNNRARSLLISTAGKVVVENSEFINSTMFGILFEGDAVMWHESGPVQDVLIRNNRFIGMGSATGDAEVIRISPKIRLSDTPEHYYNRNIVVEGNEIEKYGDDLVYACSVENFVFRNNHITKCREYAGVDNREDSFVFESCKDVQVVDNRFEWDGASAAVSTSGSLNVIVEGNEHIRMKNTTAKPEYKKGTQARN